MAISGQLFVPAYYATFQAFENDDTVSDNQLSFVDDRRELYLGKALYPVAVNMVLDCATTLMICWKRGIFFMKSDRFLLNILTMCGK